MTYDNRIKIMSDAVVDMVHGSNLLGRLLSVENSEYLDSCSPTAIRSSKNRLDCAITWLVDAIKWEKECHEEALKKEEGI